MDVKRKKLFLTGALAAVLVSGGIVLAQAPSVDINKTKNPTLAEAQEHIQQAYAKVDESQKYFKDKLGGHAEKAKELLAEANREIKAAADYVDHGGK